MKTCMVFASELRNYFMIIIYNVIFLYIIRFIFSYNLVNIISIRKFIFKKIMMKVEIRVFGHFF